MRNCEAGGSFGEGCRREDKICSWREALSMELTESEDPDALLSFCERVLQGAHGCLQFRELEEEIIYTLSSFRSEPPN